MRYSVKLQTHRASSLEHLVTQVYSAESHMHGSVYSFFFLMFIYFLKGRGRERGRQNLKQAPGLELSAQSLTWSSNS